MTNYVRNYWEIVQTEQTVRLLMILLSLSVGIALTYVFYSLSSASFKRRRTSLLK